MLGVFYAGMIPLLSVERIPSSLFFVVFSSALVKHQAILRANKESDSSSAKCDVAKCRGK